MLKGQRKRCLLFLLERRHEEAKARRHRGKKEAIVMKSEKLKLKNVFV